MIYDEVRVVTIDGRKVTVWHLTDREVPGWHACPPVGSTARVYPTPEAAAEAHVRATPIARR